MNDDLESKMNQIKDILGKDGPQDTLKNLMNLMGKQGQSQNDKDGEARKSQDSGMPFDAETLQMIFRIKQVFESMNRDDNPREKLLIALKPYMSDKRKDKLNEALKLLKMANAFEAITKLESSEENAGSGKKN